MVIPSANDNYDYHSTSGDRFTMKLPMRVPLQSPIRQLRIEQHFTLGTFIQLCDNGQVNRITWHEDGTESVFKVTE